MRTYALALVAAAFLAFPASGFSQGVEFGPGGVRIESGQHRQGRSVSPNCGELRRACLHKEELGEQGEGNCRRYRQACGRGD